MECDFAIALPYGSSMGGSRFQDKMSTIEDFQSRTRGRLGTTRGSFKTTRTMSWSTFQPHSSSKRHRGLHLEYPGRLRTTRGDLRDYFPPLHSPKKYSRACRIDIQGPTSQVDHARTGDWTPGLLLHVDHGTRRRSLHGNCRICTRIGKHPLAISKSLLLVVLD